MDCVDKIAQAREWIQHTDNIVFFGGAGTSTESGIPDFRSENGLYSRPGKAGVSPEYALSHPFMVENPDDFSYLYKNNLIYPDAVPSVLHRVLVEWEEQGKLKTIITQNVDRLHQKAGSTRVIELHGNLSDHQCAQCGKRFDVDYALQFENAAICDACGGFVRPMVTLYGESLPVGAYEQAAQAVSSADVLIVAGTSLVVYPAAGLLQYYRGNKLLLINKQTTPQDKRADLVFRDDIGFVLEQISKEA
ncbi:MAG: NAD-dependent protein deacylase [Tissierellia bacterium]|nr:NAD-dependent protein deacylase [Tissierellia bacterium]